jgi:cyclin-dependent kinase 7
VGVLCCARLTTFFLQGRCAICSVLFFFSFQPSNLLLAADGTLKLADLGMSRAWGLEGELLSPQVVTRQYRAPELLFGAPLYDAAAVDIWAAGCVVAELCTREMLFPGVSDIDQLARIFAVLGTPDDVSWPHRQLLPDFLEFEPRAAPPLGSSLPSVPPVLVGLLAQMLQLHAPRRPTAEALLAHDVWRQEPLVPRAQLLPPGLLG